MDPISLGVEAAIAEAAAADIGIAAPAAASAAGSGLTTGQLFTLAGTGLTAGGTLMAGGAANSAAKFRAAQLKQESDASIAAAQRRAEETRRKGELQQSRLQAVVASQGGGATDPTVLALGSDIAGRTEFSALTDLYNGQNRSAGLLNEAAGTEATGQAEQTGSYFKAGGTLLSGIGGMYKKFGRSAYDDPYAYG